MDDLTKWPLLLVAGEPVTEQQANEILIRTDSWSIMTNDREWQRSVWKLVGIDTDEFGRPDWRVVQALQADLGVLDLSYLDNSRIASSWIGGPRGWCDWDGTIGTSNYNIGKWPTVEEVHADWQAIAEAFPFLDLRAQLVPDEGEACVPAVEWQVRDGHAEMVTPSGTMLRRPTSPSFMAVLTVGGERGVGLPRLELAVGQVRDSRRLADGNGC